MTNPQSRRSSARLVTLSEDERRAACTEYALRHSQIPIWYKAWWLACRPFWKPVVAGAVLGIAHFLLNMYTAYPRIPTYEKLSQWEQHVSEGDKLQKQNEERDKEMKADILTIKVAVSSTKSKVAWLYYRERSREARMSAMASGSPEVAYSGKH